MKVINVPIDKVEGWKDNPRSSTPEDLERLESQVEKLGIYKPLVAFKDGEKFVVLGGNMRLEIYRKRGLKEVELVVVKVRDQAHKVALSLSDNDRAGFYDEQALAEILYELGDAVSMKDFKVDLGADESLTRVVETLGEKVEPTLAYPMKNPPGGPVICPNCGAVVEEPDGTS